MAVRIVVAGLLAGGIAFAASTGLAPPNADKSAQSKAAIQRQQSELSSADSRNKRRMREDADAGIDAERQQRLRAGEHRPPPPRFRLPLP